VARTLGFDAAIDVATLLSAVVCMALAATPAPAAGVRVEGFLDGLAVAATGSGPLQRPQGVGQLSFDSKLRRDLRAHLTLRGRVGGPFVGGSGVGFYVLDDMFQNVSPAFEVLEGWLEWRGRSAEVRAGSMRVAWGELDGIPPTDVVNPRAYHDPLVEDPEERKFGIPMAQGSWFPGDLPALDLEQVQVSLLWVPLTVPPRMALIEERWFPRSFDPSRPIVITKKQLEDAPIAPADEEKQLVVPVAFETENQPPARSLRDGGVGLRLGGRWRGVDWAAYHFTGMDTTPVMQLPVDLVGVSLVPLDVRIEARLRQDDVRVHMTGGDLAFALGPVTMRAELATFIDRPYPRVTSTLVSEFMDDLSVPDLVTRLAKHERVGLELGDLFVRRSSAEWGVGADTVWRGFMPLLQVNQIVLSGGKAPRLLIGQPDTRLTARLARRFLDERLALEMRGVYAFEQAAWFLYPNVEYLLRDDLAVDVGYLAVGGVRNTLIGQYKNNDELVLRARWTF